MVDPENPEKPVQVVVVPKNLTAELLDQARKQGPLALFLCVAVYMLWVQLDEARRQNDLTVKHVAEQHADAVKQITTTAAESLKHQAEVFRAEQDRTERILGNKVNMNAQRVREVEKKVEALEP